jgi:cytochrome c2
MLVARYGCNVCHAVPGIDGMQGTLGPALTGLAQRPTISNGTVPTSPENVRRFIVSPGSLNPATRMPPSGMSEADAADVTAYLWTLR